MPAVFSPRLLRMRCGTLLLSSLLLFCVVRDAALAQTPSYEVHPDFLAKHFTVKDGLPVNSVTGLVQGRDGYLWMTTYDGFVRFDGTHFTVFNIENSPRLLSNRLHRLVEHGDGSLWTITESGDLIRYKDGVFTTFDGASGVPGRINEIQVEGDTLWLMTRAGVGFIHEDQIHRFHPETIQGDVRAILPSRSGDLWIGMFSNELYRVRANGEVQAVTTPAGLPSNLWIRALHEDETGVIWIGGGLENGQGRVYRFQDDRLEAITEVRGRLVQPVTTISSEPNGTVWFGTGVEQRIGGWWSYRGGVLQPFSAVQRGYGVQMVMGPGRTLWRIQGRWLYYGETPVLRMIIAPRMMRFDREGNLWLAGEGGLYRLRRRVLRTVSEAEGLPSRNLYPILEDRQGSVWLGLWDAGLTRMQGNVVTTYEVDSYFVTALHEDRAGVLWVGALGMMCRMQDRRCAPFDPRSMPEGNLRIRAMHEDRQGRFWIGREQGLLLGQATETGHAWTSFTVEKGLSHNWVRAIVETGGGDVFFGTNGGGIMRYRGEGTFEPFTTAEGLSSNFVRDLYEDAEGLLWVATEDRGLCRLDRHGKSSFAGADVVCLSTAEGLFDNSLHRILEDDYGRFWFNTNRGIFWVEQAELNAFARGEVTSVTSVGYTEQDGMRNREGNGGMQPAGIKASDGRLWFPTQDGAVIIDPSQVQRLEAPPIVIETTTIGDRTEPARGTLTLAPGERDLDIGYTALAFSRPEDVRFRYKLDGYDETWKEAGDSRRATYTNLSPGKYTFRVKAGLGGAWSEEDATLLLTRQPFFWETRWFYGLLAVLFIVAGPSIYAYRVRRLKARQETLERIVAERTAKIEQQARELRHANELKSRFLANISHEFRTPLTLTFGPLNDILKNRFASLDEARPHLKRARRNGHRLLRLINQLLDLSKLDASALTLQADHYDLVAFLRQRLAAFESLAAARNLSFHFVPEAASLPHVFDAEKLETVVLNLLSNAFKFTPAGGSIVVAVRQDDAGQALLTVRDTGIGIAQDHLPYLFDRFYQVDPSTTRAREGTGIGLALVRQLVELHGGQIEAESTLGLGTTFTVTLPFLEAAHGDEPLPGTQPHEAATEAVLADLAEIPLPASNGAPANGTDEATTIILVVEDNADMRAYLRTHLDGLYHIEEAENGSVGLEKARALVPDLVLSDVMMPEMDGFALLAALKTDLRTSHVPVVLLTAKADARSKIEGLQIGADDYLAKPFDAEELRARVHNLIEQRRRLRAQFTKQGPPLYLPPVVLPSMEAAFLERVREAIEAKMAEVTFGVDDLAAAVGMSPRQLRRKLRSLLDVTPNSLIRRIRLEHAASMLGQEAGRVKEVAFAVGFKSTSRFREAFQEVYGVAPSEYAPAQPPPATST